MKSLSLWLLLSLAATPALGHFGLILPQQEILGVDNPRQIRLEVKFLHPMEQQLMEMARPKAFGVLHAGKQIDLLDQLRARKGHGLGQGQELTYWIADIAIRRPGDHLFYLEPAPYWEPVEDRFIIHYTKVCVNAFGLETGWDQPVGLKTEIIPLTRPYGLWTGNLFSGQVLVKGVPVPHAEVEVEYLNDSPENPSPVVPPADAFVTQVVRADANGIFHYAMPRAGWWGFAALSEADWTLPHDGDAKPVEIGAVFWVRTRDMQ